MPIRTVPVRLAAPAAVAAVLVCVALVLALAPGRAGAASSASVLTCGNLDVRGLLIDDITARRTTCATAKKVARALPSACGSGTSCTVRGYSCLVGRVTSELAFARCTKAKGSNELYRTIRFDYGS